MSMTYTPLPLRTTFLIMALGAMGMALAQDLIPIEQGILARLQVLQKERIRKEQDLSRSLSVLAIHYSAPFLGTIHSMEFYQCRFYLNGKEGQSDWDFNFLDHQVNILRHSTADFTSIELRSNQAHSQIVIEMMPYLDLQNLLQNFQKLQANCQETIDLTRKAVQSQMVQHPDLNRCDLMDQFTDYDLGSFNNRFVVSLFREEREKMARKLQEFSDLYEKVQWNKILTLLKRKKNEHKKDQLRALVSQNPFLHHMVPAKQMKKIKIPCVQKLAK